MMKHILVVIFFTLVISAPCEAEEIPTVGRSHSQEPYCSPKQLGMQEWAATADVIFVGIASRKELYLESRKVITDACWVKFDIEETLKGQPRTDQWVHVNYGPYDHKEKRFRNLDDLKNIDTCPIEVGTSYIAFAKQFPNDEYAETLHYVSTAVSDTQHCLPIIPTKENAEKITEIRQLLKGGNHGQH